MRLKSTQYLSKHQGYDQGYFPTPVVIETSLKKFALCHSIDFKDFGKIEACGAGSFSDFKCNFKEICPVKFSNPYLNQQFNT